MHDHEPLPSVRLLCRRLCRADSQPQSQFCSGIDSTHPPFGLVAAGCGGVRLQWAGVGRFETRERARSPLGSYRKSFRHLVRSMGGCIRPHSRLTPPSHHSPNERWLRRPRPTARRLRATTRPIERPEHSMYILVESACDGGWYRSILPPLDLHSHHPWQPLQLTSAG